MKKLALLAAACSALLLVAAVSASSRGLAGPGKPSVTMHFLEIQTKFAATMSQNRAPKLGDRFWFHSEFYNWHGGKRGSHLGHADTTAVFLTGGLAQITGVASLPGGTITVVGESGPQANSTLAIVGGTGAYATARGEVFLQSIGGENSNESSDTVRLWN
jgi:hypothetical protein